MSSKILSRLPKSSFNKVLNVNNAILKAPKPEKGTCLVSVFANPTETSTFLMSETIDLSFFRNYYIPLYIDSHFTRSQTPSGREFYYDKIQATGRIPRTIKSPAFFAGFSSVWDLSSDVSFLLASPVITTFEKRLEAFKNFLINKLDQIELEFQSVALVFPAAENVLNPKQEKENTTGAFLLELVKKDPYFFEKYKNTSLYISSKEGKFLSKILTNSDQNKSFGGIDLVRLISVMRSVYKLSKGSIDSEVLNNSSLITEDLPTSTDTGENKDKEVFFVSQRRTKNAVLPDQVKLFASPISAIANAISLSEKFATTVEPLADSNKRKVYKVSIPVREFQSSSDAIKWVNAAIGGTLLGTTQGDLKVDRTGTDLVGSGVVDNAKIINTSRFLEDAIVDSAAVDKFIFRDEIIQLELVCSVEMIRLSLANELFSKIVKENKSRSPNAVELELVDNLKAEVYAIVDSQPLEVLKSENALEVVYDIMETSPRIQSLTTDLVQNRKVSNRSKIDKGLLAALNQKQKDSGFTVDGKSVKDKLNQTDDSLSSPPLPIDVSNEFVKHNLTDNLDKIYREKHRLSDMNNIFQHFSKDKNLPVFVSDVKISDSSDPFNLKETLEVTFSVPNKRPQTFKIFVPKITSDGYLYTNGTKKFVTKQLIPLPIVKIKSSGEDVVQFTTNYNKMFIGRLGTKLNPDTTKLLKTAAAQPITKDYKIFLGSNGTENSKFVNNLEYNELEKSIVRIEKQDLFIYFNRKIMNDLLRKNPKVDFQDIQRLDKDGTFPIGLSDESIYFCNQQGHVLSYSFQKKPGLIDTINLKKEKNNLFSFIKDEVFNDEAREVLKSASAGKKFMYSYVKVSGRKIPLVAFVGYIGGLDEVLERYAIPNTFSEKPDKRYNRHIRFSDGWLNYSDTEVRFSLLLSGLGEINTSEMSIQDFGIEGNGYKNYFFAIDAPNLSKALDNFTSLFIDPITIDILKELDLPHEMFPALLYCNTLLEASKVLKKKNINGYRLRGAESINSMLYKLMADTVRKYRNTANSTTSSIGITAKPDALMQELSASPIIEPVSTLNPVEEAMNRSKATYKGPTGSQFGHAKGTEETRAYDGSMVGILAATSTDDNKVGITRYTVMNPSLTSTRGFIDTEDRELNPTNMLNIAEMLAPFTPQHADSPRKLHCAVCK